MGELCLYPHNRTGRIDGYVFACSLQTECVDYLDSEERRISPRSIVEKLHILSTTCFLDGLLSKRGLASSSRIRSKIEKDYGGASLIRERRSESKATVKRATVGNNDLRLRSRCAHRRKYRRALKRRTVRYSRCKLSIAPATRGRTVRPAHQITMAGDKVLSGDCRFARRNYFPDARKEIVARVSMARSLADGTSPWRRATSFSAALFSRRRRRCTAATVFFFTSSPTAVPPGVLLSFSTASPILSTPSRFRLFFFAAVPF